MILGIGSSDPKTTSIGIGMWLGIIMAYNVWFVIWPNQKSFRIIDCTPEEKLNQQKPQCYFLEQIHYSLFLCCFYGGSSKSILVKALFFLLLF